jgi:hypothetical protein
MVPRKRDMDWEVCSVRGRVEAWCSLGKKNNGREGRAQRVGVRRTEMCGGRGRTCEAV